MDIIAASDYPWSREPTVTAGYRNTTMATVFVAKSDSLQKWGLEVGLTKHLYALGTSDAGAKAAVAALNQRQHAGRADWTLVRHEAVDAPADEAELLARLGRKETAIDPAYYPQLKGARDIFKIKIANVENQILVQKALAGEAPKEVRMTPGLIAAYLIRAALG
jgi:hypothetical protein